MPTIGFLKAWVRWRLKSRLIKKAIPIRVIQLHYHLKPGGVTTVIHHLSNCFKNLGLKQQIFHGDPYQVDKINGKYYPELGYQSNKNFSCEKIIQALESEVLEDKEKVLLWCHNHNLGKNPALTQALWQISLNKPSNLQIIFHQHDFPEENRPENQQILKNWEKTHNLPEHKWLYPSGIKVCINQEGFRKCKTIRASDTVFLLPNPVAMPSVTNSKTQWLRDKWELYCHKQGFICEPHNRILIYPGRILPRKNPYEALLLAKILGSDFHVLFTLSPSHNDFWGQRFHQFLQDEKLKASFGFGNHLGDSINLVDLFHLSDTAIHTSIQEGFGYGIIEPFLYKKNIIGRRLNDCHEFFERFGMQFPSFYNKIPIRTPNDKSDDFAEDFANICDDKKREILRNGNWRNIVSQNFQQKIKALYASAQKKHIHHNSDIIGKVFSIEMFQQKLAEIIEYCRDNP